MAAKGTITEMGYGSNHIQMEGRIALADEQFELTDGSMTDAPGQSGIAAHDINCRCFVRYKLVNEEEYIRLSNKNFEGKAFKYVDKSTRNSIIKAEALSTRFVNSSDGLFKNSAKIKPIEGFEDIVIHGDKTGFAYHDKNGNEMYYTVREFADILKNSNVYYGGNIRLISCETGADGATAAQSLAEQLNVTVMAPSNTVWVMPDGAMSIGDTPTVNDGEWRIFKPKKE